MSDIESSDYSLWVKLANDPSQSEEARRQYRTKMEAHINEKLREALQFATKQISPTADSPPKR
jgi:hypothetical protein